MRLDFAKHFLAHQEQHASDPGRRDAMKKIGAAGAAAAVTGAGATAIGAGPVGATGYETPSGGPYTDEMFDVEAAKAGAWVPSPYGAGDQRGSFNELTPERTAKAFRRINDQSCPFAKHQFLNLYKTKHVTLAHAAGVDLVDLPLTDKDNLVEDFFAHIYSLLMAGA